MFLDKILRIILHYISLNNMLFDEVEKPLNIKLLFTWLYSRH